MLGGPLRSRRPRALTAFGAYSLFAAVEGSNYLYTKGGARYLSPFYSPDLKSMFGLSLPFSYAFLVLWAPLGLRLTCYYYRKAYYRSFFLSPPACAVSGARAAATAARPRFPFVLQNAHRYFLYFATIVLGFLWYDAVRSVLLHGPRRVAAPSGVGLGSLVLLANVVALSLFTFGCNSLPPPGRRQPRLLHLLALDPRTRHRLWPASPSSTSGTALGLDEPVTVGLADLYIRLASAGVFHDPRIF